MPAEVIKDTVKDAWLEYSEGGDVRRRVRTGIIKNLPLGILPDPDVLDDALNATGAPLMMEVDPTDSNRALTTTRIEPVSASMVRAFWMYETPEKNASTSIYILRDESYDGFEDTNVLPGSDVPISVSWTDGSRTVPTDLIMMRLPFSMRSIKMTKTIFGSPPSDVKNAHNKANGDVWQGLGAGFWRVNYLLSDQARYSGHTTYSVGVISRVDRDWSSYGTLQEATGKFVPLTQADITPIQSVDYSWGVHAGNGIVRVCPFKTTTYATLFGFS